MGQVKKKKEKENDGHSHDLGLRSPVVLEIVVVKYTTSIVSRAILG